MDGLVSKLYTHIVLSSDIDNAELKRKAKEEITLEYILKYLLRITENKEEEIHKEVEKPFKTDKVENEWKYFTTECMKSILAYYEEIRQENLEEKLAELLGYRHWGYGFLQYMRNKGNIDISGGNGRKKRMRQRRHLERYV